MPKPPPPFVKNIGAWEYTLAKLGHKNRLTVTGDPQNYAAAVAIYKNVCKKYAHFGVPNIDVQPIRTTTEASLARTHVLNDLADKFPVGKLFYFDDVLCKSIERHADMAIFPDPDGFLLIHAEVLDVDPDGQYADWPIGKIFGAAPHRSFLLSEA